MTNLKNIISVYCKKALTPSSVTSLAKADFKLNQPALAEKMASNAYKVYNSQGGWSMLNAKTFEEYFGMAVASRSVQMSGFSLIHLN